MPRSHCRKACEWEILLNSFLENTICANHCGKSSTSLALGLSDVSLPFLLQPFLLPRWASMARLGESPSLSRSPSLLFSHLHQRRQLTVLLHSLTPRVSTATFDQICINNNMVQPQEHERGQYEISSLGCVLARRGHGMAGSIAIRGLWVNSDPWQIHELRDDVRIQWCHE